MIKPVPTEYKLTSKIFSITYLFIVVQEITVSLNCNINVAKVILFNN